MVSDFVFLWCVCVFLSYAFSFLCFLFYYLLVFLRERERRSGVGKVGSGEDLGEDEGEGVARIYRMKKIPSIKMKTKYHD